MSRRPNFNKSQSRKGLTARELAEKFNCSQSTIYKMIADPRDEFMARAHARQDEAWTLRLEGMTYGEIAKRLDITRGAAVGLVRRARPRHEDAPSQTPSAAT